MAQQLLTQFQDHEDAWTRVDSILEKSNVPQTKVKKMDEEKFTEKK